MKLALVASFEVAHKKLTWPWVAIDPTHTRIAFVKPTHTIGTRVIQGEVLVEGSTFELPRDLRLPNRPPSPSNHRGVPKGLHGIAVAPNGEAIALTAAVGDASVIVTLTNGSEVRSTTAKLGAANFIAHAITFDRGGTRLWVSLESGEETALMLLDARSHEVFGIVRSAPFPPPALHELHVHPQDDAVLLLASCGQDGTFARIAGWAGEPSPTGLESALDEGGPPAGFVGFSADGARVHLVEDAALRTHAWPGLQELSSVPLPDDFASTYAGVVMGDRLFLDGEDADEGEGDLVMQFDRSGILGKRVREPVPSGMWVGRLGQDVLVTVSSGEPAEGRAYKLPAPPS